MGKEFSLELGLWPSSQPTFQGIPMIAIPFTLNREQQIMVFYNETSSMCDLGELQARAILRFANQERNGTTRWDNSEWLSLQMPKSENRNRNERFSIKKSLKRFLQMRKARRIQSMSPYQKL